LIHYWGDIFCWILFISSSISSLPQILNSQTQLSNDGSSVQNAELKSQVQQVQAKILSDPSLMEDIQHILENEEIKTILSDPKLLNDVMSLDQNKIQQNDNVQNLMNNPQMQELINKIQQKMSPQ